MVSTSSLEAVIGFLDRNYRYKSIATQILQDAGLTPIQTLVENRPHRGLNQYRL